jgi:hypothetical protein
MANDYANIGTLSPEMFQQQQELTRQQRMAEMLMGQNQQPQGQMISGRYVAPSWAAQLAPVTNMLAGAYLGKKADEKALDYAKAIREQGLLESQRLMNTWGGTPAVEKTTELAGPFTGNVPMPVATQEISPAKAGNAKLAFAEALNMSSPQARALLPHLATEAFKPQKWEKAEYTDERTGKTRQGVIDVNSPNPISTFQVGGVKPEMSAYERASLNMRGAELADQGIGGYGGGGQVTGQRSNVSMVQPTGQSKANPYAPSSMPVYEPDPSLTPKQNRELAVKFSEENQKLVKNAKNSFDLLKEAAGTLRTGNPSSGRGENIITGAREFFGGGGETSKADAILTIYGTKLTQQVPRFEGPQSDKDTALYQAAAGDIGNPNKPIPTRLAAVQTMVDLNKKYYPNGDWSSIDTGLPNSDKVSLGAPQYATNPQTGERRMSTDGGKTWNPVR